jgi:hypothetical protein
MICSSLCLVRFTVWSFPEVQTPIHPGSIQGGNVRSCEAALLDAPETIPVLVMSSLGASPKLLLTLPSNVA